MSQNSQNLFSRSKARDAQPCLGHKVARDFFRRLEHDQMLGDARGIKLVKLVLPLPGLA